MHRVEHFLTGDVDLHPHLLGQGVCAVVQLLVADAALADVHQHDHGEHALQDALGHVFDVDVELTAQGSNFCDDATVSRPMTVMNAFIFLTPNS